MVINGCKTKYDACSAEFNAYLLSVFQDVHETVGVIYRWGDTHDLAEVVGEVFALWRLR